MANNTDIATFDAEFEERGTALAPASPVWTPSFAVAVDDAIFMKKQKNRFFLEVMEADKHYGVIPGTGTKPTLLKPGAEMLLANMGLQPSLTDEEAPIVDVTGDDHGGEAYIHYRRVCRIYRQTGPKEDDRMIVAQASGSCSSWEPKYRYRNGQITCPQCGKQSVIKGKKEYGGGWICFAKKGGCGAKFADRDAAITSQETGKVANPDIAELENTILKMADKRALVAATLLATGCSDIFTQDIEDMSSAQAPAAAAPVEKAKPAAADKTTPSSAALYHMAEADGLCTDGASFCEWAKRNAAYCADLRPGGKVTLEQRKGIHAALLAQPA